MSGVGWIGSQKGVLGFISWILGVVVSLGPVWFVEIIHKDHFAINPKLRD